MNPSKPLGKLRAWLAHLTLAATTAATAQQSQEPSSTTTTDEVVKLSPFTVSATATVGYGSLMNTSGRLAKAYQDVPQMANVVTSEFLQDMKRFDTFEALTFVPGVNGNTTVASTLKIRGLDSSTRFFDGFKGPAFGFGSVFDMAFMDRIEVVKGPAPGSFGRGDPAGFVNYIIKDPTFRRSTEVDVMIGTGNDDTMSQRYMIDTNGLITKDGQTAFRVVAVSSTGAERPKFSEYEHNGVLLALKRNLKGRGSLSLKMLGTSDTIPGTCTPLNVVDPAYQGAWYATTRDYGLPSVKYSLLDPNAWLAYDDSHSSSKSLRTTAVLDYKIVEHWSTRQAVNFMQSKSDSDMLWNGSYILASDGVTALNHPLRQLLDSAYRSRAYQSDFVGQYRIPAIDCSLEILAGGDYSRTITKQATDNQFPDGQPLANWNPYIPLPGWSINPNEKYYRQVVDESSLYGQLEARFWGERLRLTGSWRNNYTDLNGINTVNNSTIATKTHSPLLPAYSVLFKINEALSVYALHSQYIEPPSTQFLYGRVFQSSPLSQLRGVFQPKTDLDEIGFKGNLLHGRFSFSVCAYDLKQRGAPKQIGIMIEDKSQTTDLNGNVSFTVPSDAGAKGLEFECFGKITAKLTFTLNGSYVLSSHTLGAISAVVGQPSIITHHELAYNPDTLAGYFSYSFTGSRGRGLTLTGGWKTLFSGWEMDAGIDPYPYPQTKTIVDLGATYGYNDRWQFYLKGNNVFERAFTVTAGLGVVYGRKVLAGATVRF